MRLCLLNLLFIFFSLTGFIVFGISPAYTAMSVIMRKLIAGEDVRIITTYYQLFKSEVVQSNKFGLLYVYLCVLLVVNFIVIRTLPSNLQTVSMLVLIILLLIVVSSLIYIFPLHATYKSTLWTLIKNSYVVAIIFLPRTLLTLMVIYAIIVLCLFQPSIALFLGFSSINAIVVLNSEQCFKKITISSQRGNE